MSDKKTFICDHCNASFTIRGNYYRHKKYMCSVKIEQEKKKFFDAQNETKLYYEKIIEDLKNEFKTTREKLENKLKITNNLLKKIKRLLMKKNKFKKILYQKLKLKRQNKYKNKIKMN